MRSRYGNSSMARDLSNASFLFPAPRAMAAPEYLTFPDEKTKNDTHNIKG
jgi:hypothetical protein